MKKFIYTFVVILTLGTGINNVSAAENKAPKTELTTAQKIQLEKITNRLEEIRKMDKSHLSRAERVALRKELKEMKQEAKALNGGVYLSVGAIIIIILLLILIL
jgi:hypothetical protein